MASRSNRVRGFSLMEVVISIAIVSVIIPIVLALTVTGGRGSAEAADETRAMLMVRGVLHELRLARDGQGELIDGTLEWPAFPQSAERYVFTADRSGNLLARVEQTDYDKGTSDEEAVFLVSARGEEHPLESVPEARDLSKVEITVETPPRADSENRRKMRFMRLIHPDD